MWIEVNTQASTSLASMFLLQKGDIVSQFNSLLFSSFQVLAQLSTSALQVCPQTLSRKTDELLSLRSHTAKKQLIKESKAEDFDKFTLVVVVLRKLVTSGETVTTPLFAKTPPPRAAALLN